MLPFEVHILGCSSATPTSNRFPTAQIVKHHDKSFLVDCGEGTQMQIRRYKHRMNRMDQVFISHLHGDHYFGLIGLLSSFHLLGRTKDLQLFGPPELMDILVQQFRASKTYLRYHIDFTPTQTEGPLKIWEDNGLEVYSFPLTHKIHTCGFLFKEKPKPRHIIRTACDAVGAKHFHYSDLKIGKDFITESGECIPNDQLTTDPPPSRSYAFCSDTAYQPILSEWLKDVDLLYHETTFMESEAQRATDTKHSTAQQAALIAHAAGAKQLLMGHYSARYKSLDGLLKEAQAVFPASILSEEGQCYPIGEN